MLAEINRLKNEQDFENLFKKGKSFKVGFLTLKIAKNNLKESHYGFVTAKKFFKKTVLRNKIKRRLRSIIRQNIKDIKKGVDVVLIALPGLEKKSFSEIKEILDLIFKKTGLIRK